MHRWCRWICVVALAACGDDGGGVSNRDAATDTREPDASNAGCDHVEQRDSTNDDLPPANGTPEPTSLSFASHTVVCGTFDHTHFDGDITVDVDSYTLMLPVETGALVRIKATGAEAIELVGIDLYTGANLDQAAGQVTFYGDHGVSFVRLAAGMYKMRVFALHAEAIPASVAYEVDLVSDSPEFRCQEQASGGYMELNDGASNNGNDVYRIASGTPPALSTSTTDMPEATGLTLSTTANRRVSGTAANVTTTDLYEDKDTFAIATGAQMNEMTVHLAWAGTATNMDFILFEAGTTTVVARGTTAALQGPELRTFGIKPSASYSLLIGARTGGTVPMTYSASLCAAQYPP